MHAWAKHPRLARCPRERSSLGPPCARRRKRGCRRRGRSAGAYRRLTASGHADPDQAAEEQGPGIGALVGLGRMSTAENMFQRPRPQSGNPDLQRDVAHSPDRSIGVAARLATMVGFDSDRAVGSTGGCRHGPGSAVAGRRRHRFDPRWRSVGHAVLGRPPRPAGTDCGRRWSCNRRRGLSTACCRSPGARFRHRSPRRRWRPRHQGALAGRDVEAVAAGATRLAAEAAPDVPLHRPKLAAHDSLLGGEPRAAGGRVTRCPRMCVGLSTGWPDPSPVAAGTGACTTTGGGAATSVGPPTMVQAAS